MKLKAAQVVMMSVLVGMSAIGAEVRPPFEPVERDGNVLETLKHRITVGESGLPEQLYIKAARHSLPLEVRAGEMDLSAGDLLRLGRGPQLRRPLRLEAVVEGGRVVAEPREPASVTEESEGRVSYASVLEAGPLQIELKAAYECDGAMKFEVGYGGRDVELEVLELVFELDGRLSFAYRGLPSGFRADEVDYNVLDVSVPTDRDTTVWTSADEWAPGADGAFVPYLLFGSHDRAFTWIAEDDSGFSVGEDVPMILIERDDMGYATVRIRIAGGGGALEGDRAVGFALLMHPSRPREPGHQNVQWLNWLQGADVSGVDGLENLSAGLRERVLESEEQAVLTPLTAGFLESAADGYELRGHAGGDGVSADLDNVRLYPNSLFSVFAGPFRNRPARVRSNVREIVSGGVNINYDRQILGRALALGIGASIKNFLQPAQHLHLIRNLDKFGLFEDDETEILPYWRNEAYMRYGEEWDEDDPFALEMENPSAGVYVTAYRRRFSRNGREGYHVLFVVMNERDNPVRQRLYVLDPERVFGGSNRFHPVEAERSYDFRSGLPPDSDWGGLRWEGRRGLREPEKIVLRDLDREGAGFVDYCSTHWERRRGPEIEIYGPLFIYPRDFRIVYGYWIED